MCSIQALRVNINNLGINNISEWCLINAVRKENFTLKSASAELLLLSLSVTSTPFREINKERYWSVNCVECGAKSTLKKVLKLTLRDLIQHWTFYCVRHTLLQSQSGFQPMNICMNVAPPPGKSEAHLSQTGCHHPNLNLESREAEQLD